jgi:hypothetical protein
MNYINKSHGNLWLIFPDRCIAVPKLLFWVVLPCRLIGVTIQKNNTDIFTTMRTSNFTEMYSHAVTTAYFAIDI